MDRSEVVVTVGRGLFGRFMQTMKSVSNRGIADGMTVNCVLHSCVVDRAPICSMESCCCLIDKRAMRSKMTFCTVFGCGCCNRQ